MDDNLPCSYTYDQLSKWLHSHQRVVDWIPGHVSFGKRLGEYVAPVKLCMVHGNKLASTLDEICVYVSLIG